MGLINNIIKTIIFHPKCTICDKFGSYLCERCANELNMSFNPTIVETTHENVICASSFVYEGLIKKIIREYKFKNQKKFFKILSPFLERTVKKFFKGKKFDLIGSVPSYYSSENERGYNQSELLGVELSKRLNIPYEKCLIKIKKNKIQHGLSFKERQLNVKGVYKRTKNYDNKRILLCDDIITTGATLNECVRELNSSGARTIGITLAYVLKESF